MRKILLFISMFLISLAALAAPRYTRIIAFGDSLSDIGNNPYANLHPDIPYAPSGAPITNDQKGKRGHIWIQDLLQIGHGTLFKYRAIVRSEDVRHPMPHTSIDNAWAGAETIDGYSGLLGLLNEHCVYPGKNKYGLCNPGVLNQVRRYLKALPVDKQALYVIWSGGNDIVGRGGLLMDMFKHPSHIFRNLHSISWDPTSNIIKAAVMLNKAGVPSRHIVIINLPNAARVPIILKMLKGKPLLKDIAAGTVDSFNKALNNKIVWQWYKHHRYFQLINIHEFMKTVMKDPKKYGYKNVTNECMLNKKAFDGGCKGYFFYNGEHPTTQTHMFFAKYIKQQLLR